jgi:hypothetical protein
LHPAGSLRGEPDNFARFDAKLEQRIVEVDARIKRHLGGQTRWLFIAWTTIMIAVIGLRFQE